MVEGAVSQYGLWAAGGRLRRLYLPQFSWASLALLLGIIGVWPVVQLELRAFADGGAAFGRMLALPNFAETAATTFILAVGSTLIALTTGTALAWCAALLPARVRAAGQLLPLLPLLVPPVASVIGWMFLLSPTVGYLNQLLRLLPGLDDTGEGPLDVYTVPAIVALTGLILSAFVYMFVRTGLERMGGDFEDAAATCGASPLRRFFTVTVPLLRPSLLFATGVVFMLALGQFAIPLILGRTRGVDVLMTEMFRVTQNYPVDHPLGAALGAPILLAGIAFVLLQRFALRDQRRYVVVSAKSRNATRETRWWAAAAIGLHALLTTILPLLALIYVSFSPFWTAGLNIANLTTRHYSAVFANPRLVQAIWTSTTTSLFAVAVVLVLGFGGALALVQTTRVLRPIRLAIDILATMPLAVPASLLGFGLLFAYTGPPIPLYGTSGMLILTYVTLMIGYAIRLLFATLLATGQEFREASYACGAGPVRTLLRVTLPLSRRGIGATAALTFVLLFHEFSASVMVRSPRVQVIGSAAYEIFVTGLYPQVAVLALIMVVVTLVGVAAALWCGGAQSLGKA